MLKHLLENRHTIGSVNNDTCLTTRRANATVISNVYEGIPETILLNVITWVLLILLFAILRNRAWDYGRLALVHTEKWTQLFYKNTDDAVAVEESSADVSLIPDAGCLWFPSIFKISKERIFTRCGPDASHYLSFQEQLLLLSTTITVFALCVILPINFQGKLQGGKTTFGHTTLSNLEPSSNWLWVHVVASFCFVPLTVLIMRRSSGRIPSASALTSRTVMITHISHAHRNTDDIKNYFTVRFPDTEIKDIQIAYRIKKLTILEKQRALTHEAKMYCILNNKPDLKVQPYGCIICCPWKTQNALEYYTEEEARLTDLVVAERRKVLESPLGIAFITLNSEESAHHVIKSFTPGSLRHWLITKAPSPSDINWENLEISYRNWYSKAILINAILFLILFFLTTPVIVVNVFNNLTSAQDKFLSKLTPLLSDFLPTLLLLSVSALMPVLVAYSDEWMSHWTKSKQNHATMHKAFFFLLFMVLILPSLGLTSAQAFVEWSLQTGNLTVRWECVFLADKGAFFINYVITSALIGTALELLRFPELAMYAFRLLRIKSEAEKTSIRKEIMSEFPFGIHYAWTLLIFTISTVYSLTCPLITPFGLLYLSLKHFVDKYNIYYVYRPITMCGEGQQIHADAVRMVRVAILLLQLIMAAFSFIRGGFNIMCAVSFIAFIVTVTFFFFLSPFPSCRPIQNNNTALPEFSEQYIAPVLLSSQNIEQGDEYIVSSPSSYGSSNINDIGVRLMSEIGSSVA
ncbi:calcium permeable stress-gated cation channel 1 [Tribolium madens]|uniref:calcium permeable stress-gated cation channel 1 n=1 Tax=Tribolium madens TaxID=41895 RepID=UPI001CF76629|nr:calcium permeable stress-gated cation channel 1 [Tribolium madens]